MQHYKKTSLLGRIVKEQLTINQDKEMPYRHITLNQRNELSALLRAKIKQKDIARMLEKDRTTIYREIKRNGKYYHARIAKKKTKERRIKANQRFRKIENNQWLKEYIVRRLKLYWSPEQIAGRLKKDYGRSIVGKDTIYKYIYNERKDLIKYLRCQKGKYRRRYGTRIREKQREELKKRRVDTRPEVIDSRRRIGDWEGDTVEGKGRSGWLLTNVERRSGFLLADKLERATSANVLEKTTRRFNRLPKKKRLSMTYDNGSEFASYEMIERLTGMTIYFAYPYCSWERGTNENTNGLLRQFFPKKSRFDNITQQHVNRAVYLINRRPRKRLNYLTPYEVFYKGCALE